MKREDYIVTQGWMYDLPLTDKQRTVYALIWGYSRNGYGCWRGTAKELAEWARCGERHAQKIVHQLEEMGLIAHTVITWSNGKTGGVRSEFWANQVVTPSDGTKDRIDWTGRRSGGLRTGDRKGLQTGDRNPHTDSNSIQRLVVGGGKNNARSRAKKTTTTGFLFENDESWLAPGNPTILALPFEDPYFVDAWKKLVRQPKWSGKSPEALQLTLDAFAETGDPVLSAFCCIKAIENDWPKITDPSKIGLDDQEQLESFADKCTGIARKEGGEA